MKILEMQSQDRKQFENLRREHRRLIHNDADLIAFDYLAQQKRHWLRKWHKKMRSLARKTLSDDEQLNFSIKMAENCYDLCKIPKCKICNCFQLCIKMHSM